MLSALGFREELSKCLLHEAQTAWSSRARTFICEISFLWILWSSCNSAQLLHLQLVLMKLKLLAIWRVQLLPPEGEIKRKIATPPLPASAPSYEKGRWFRLNWKSWANLVGSFFVTPREFLPPHPHRKGEVTQLRRRTGLGVVCAPANGIPVILGAAAGESTAHSQKITA